MSKYALVTGGFGGLGQALGQKLVNEGFSLLIIDQAKPQSIHLDENSFEFFQQDITDNKAYSELLNSIFSKFNVELVIANAGVDWPQSFDNFSWEKGVKLMEINTNSNVVLLSTALKHFKQNGRGHFVGISSLASMKAFPYEGAYCASKIALKYMIDSARSEYLDEKDIHFTTIFPGYIETEMVKGNAFDVKGLISPQKAAEKIYGAIKAKKAAFYFPKSTYVQLKVLNALPTFLQDRISKTATIKSKVGHAILITLLSSGANGFNGTVKDVTGNPISGVTVTFEYPETKNTHSTFTNENGVFKNDRSGSGTLRFRHYMYTDISFPTEEGKSAKFAVTMKKKVDVSEISDTLPAVYHATELYKNVNKIHREELVTQCMMCHQLGNKLTRTPRSHSAWEATVSRMEGMASLLTFSGKKEIVNKLHETYTGDPLAIDLIPSPENHLDGVEIREWPMATGISHIHDIVVARSGMIYGVDMSLDALYILNPVTNEVQKKDFPKHPTLPQGGVFSGAMQPLGTMGATWGPHSLQEDSKGNLWITCSLSGDLVKYDVSSGEFERVAVEKGVYPHTLRIKDDVIWFSIAISNQFGRYDINTGEMKIIDLPYGGLIQFLSTTGASTILKIASWFPAKNLHLDLSMHKISGQGNKVLPLPYGVDFDPTDGSVWYSKLNGGKIGRIDPVTFEVKEWDTPYQGPRRLRFSRDGTLWIPAFVNGVLMSFDTKSESFKSFPLPTFEDALIETPYALNIHPRTQNVWMTGGLSDRLIEFDPRERKFKAYPLPTQVTFMREIEFLHENIVCSSYANLPAHAIEGGTPKVFCLTPTKGTE